MADIGIRVVVLGVAEARRNVGAVQSDINNLEKTIRGVSGTTASFGRTITQVGSALTGFGRTLTIAVTAPIAALGASLVEAGIQFEDAFAGIGKTVEGVMTPMGALTEVGQRVRDEFRQLALDIPVATNAIAGLGEVVGQLGVKAEDISSVTELIAKLGATTNLSAEEAATGLIRFANIMEGTAVDVEDFVSRAGSAIVALGNASVSTESEILNLAMRLAAAGDRADFSSQQILAWATTLSDVGVRAELGGTAVSRAITEILFAVQTGGDGIATFAQIAGQSIEEFSRAFEEDASAALLNFIEKLEAGIRAGTVTKDMLLEMGLSGTRTIDVLGRLGDVTDIFAGNLEIANGEWERQLALEEEFQKRATTVASQIQIMKNRFTDLGITIFDLVRDDLVRLIEGLGSVFERFKALDPVSQKMIITFAAMAATIGPILIILGALISVIGTVVTAFAALLTPIGLVVIAVGGLSALIAASYGSEITKFIQPVIDKFQELADILFGMPDVSISAPTQDARQNRPFLEEDIAAGLDPNAVIPPETFTIVQRFQMVLDNIKQTLSDMIPPSTMVSLRNFAAGVILTTTLVKTAFLAVIDTIKVTLGPAFSELLAELTELLAAFGLDWSDVWAAIGDVLVGAAILIGATLLAIIAIVIGLINGITEAATTFVSFLTATKASYEIWVQGIKDTLSGLGLIIQGFFNLMSGLVSLVANLFTGSNEEIKASFDQLYLGIRQVVEGIVTALLGMVETVVGLVLILFNAIIGITGSILAFMMGVIGGIFSFITQMYNQLTGTTDNFMTETLSLWQGFSDGVTQVVSDLVTGITSFFQKLFDDLIGHSIITDMITAILSAISDFKDAFLGFIGELVTGAVDKFTELAGKVGEVLANLFGGGGEGGGFQLDLSAIEDAKAKIEDFKLALTSLQTAITTAATAFVTGFVMVVIAQTILATQTFILLWQNAAILFSTALLLVTLSWSTMSLTLQAMTIEMTALIVLLWTDMTIQITLAIQAMITIMITQHTLLQQAIQTAVTAITAVYTSMVQTVLSLFNQMIAGMVLVEGANKRLLQNTMETIPVATSYVDGLAGAFKLLGAAATAAAAAVVAANKAIEESSNAANENSTESPELKIQHAFERFKKYLDTTDFNFNTSGIESEMLGVAENVVTAVDSISQAMSNIIGVDDIVPWEDKESGGESNGKSGGNGYHGHRRSRKDGPFRGHDRAQIGSGADILAVLSSIVPVGMSTNSSTTDNSVQIGDISGVPGTTDNLPQMLVDRIRRARSRGE